MSECDLPTRLEVYGAGAFTLHRIALTRSGLQGLPSFSAKKDDPRFGWYVDNYGTEAWELDAMDPNELRQTVENMIKRFIDPEEWKHHKKIEATQRETTRRIAAAMAGAK
jgi:hypothetical protein